LYKCVINHVICTMNDVCLVGVLSWHLMSVISIPLQFLVVLFSAGVPCVCMYVSAIFIFI
jgi:hypothetical protein